MSNAKIFVAQMPELLPKNWQPVDTLAIVIDTLRFTSTACQALAAGAKSIVVEAEVSDAMSTAARIGPFALLCGERHCAKIGGFHLGNSPLEYTASAVADRHLVFSTTNGTRAVLSVSQAKYVALGSLLNRSAVAEYALRRLDQREVTQVMLVCAGTDGEIAAEDVLTAGAIIERLMGVAGNSLTAGNDSTLMALNSWQALTLQANDRFPLQQSISSLFEQSAGGRNLIEAGFQHDLTAVSKLDSSRTVPARIAADSLRFECVDELSS